MNPVLKKGRGAPGMQKWGVGLVEADARRRKKKKKGEFWEFPSTYPRGIAACSPEKARRKKKRKRERKISVLFILLPRYKGGPKSGLRCKGKKRKRKEKEPCRRTR